MRNIGVIKVRENLKKARQEAGMTQQAMADRQGFIRQRLETLEVVQRIAIVLAIVSIVIDLI